MSCGSSCALWLAAVAPWMAWAQPPVPLAAGAKVTRELEGAAVDRLAATLPAGQYFKIVVMQTGADVVVTLRDPAQRVVMTSDLPNGTFGAETVAAVAESAGDYVVEVKLANPQRTPRGKYEAALETRAALPGDAALAVAYRKLSEADLLRQKHTPEARRQAFELLGAARAPFAASGDAYAEAWTVTMSGSMSAEAGEMREALRYAEQAAGLFHQAGDANGEALARNNMGGMLDVLGEPRRAMEAYRAALTLSRAGGNRVNEVSLLNNIGKLELDQANWQAALADFEQALAIARQSGDERYQGLVIHNMAAVHLRLGEYEEVLDGLEKALPLRRAARDRRGEAETLQVFGNTYSAMKQPARALASFEQALAIETSLGDRRKQAELLRDVGRAHTELGKFAEAEASIRKAVEGEKAAHDRRHEALALRDLSTVLVLAGRPAEGQAAAEEALALLRAMGDPITEARTLESIARAESARGNLPAARVRMEEALRATEENRRRAQTGDTRASFFATQQDSYDFYIDLLMRLGDPGAALEASEQARARSLIEMLGEAGAEIREGVDPQLVARAREISDVLNAKGARLLPLLGRETPQAAALREEIRKLEIEYRDTQAAIRKSSPRYAELTEPTPLTVEQIREQALDADTVLLEYSLGEKRSFVWAVSREGMQSWELPARDRIEEQVAAVYGLLTARAAAPPMETAAARRKRLDAADAALPGAARVLSEMVLAPAAAAIAGKRIVVAPDGALQRLPFAMLPLPGSEEPLIGAHEVVMLPSASALAALRTELAGRTAARRTLAVFADPVFERADGRAPVSKDATRLLAHLAPAGGGAASLKIPRLPYTAQEAEQILRVAGGQSNWDAEGFDASRAAALSGRLGEYRYVHFATHGYLDAERPALSALVLAQFDREGRPLDGFLRVNDIYNTRLAADLVVLSACQTGLGREVRGEGLMGMTRAFLYAGAPRVIVSLWNVNDRATAELMAGLYRAILRDGMRPSAALRQSQLAIRKQKQWQSPYYWAAFVQHGEWK